MFSVMLRTWLSRRALLRGGLGILDILMEIEFGALGLIDLKSVDILEIKGGISKC